MDLLRRNSSLRSAPRKGRGVELGGELGGDLGGDSGGIAAGLRLSYGGATAVADPRMGTRFALKLCVTPHFRAIVIHPVRPAVLSPSTWLPLGGLR